MEVIFRVAVTLVLLTGSFWEVIANILININSTEKKKMNNNNTKKKKEIITIRPQIIINAVHDRGIAKNQDHNNINNCDDFHILADDMMRKILSQLPPETMIKCKSVSRSWRRLIIEGCSFLIPRLDPYPLSGLIICRKGTFMTLSPERDMFYCLLPLRERGSMITKGGILCYKDRLIQPNLLMADSFLQHLPLSSLHHDFREILDYCNGLLLFRDSNLENSSLTLPPPPCYVICNPTTSEFVKIPGEITDTPNFASGALAYDPSESLHYKVVIIIVGQSNLLKIFSSDTLRWTKSYFHLEKNTTSPLEVQSYQSIYSGGILYKLSTSGQLIRIFTETNVVQSVDLPIADKRINIKSDCIGITDGRLSYALLADSELRIFILEGSNYAAGDTNDLNWSLNLHQKLDRLCTPRCEFVWPKVYAFHPQNPGNIFMCCEIIEDGSRWRANTFMICYNYKNMHVWTQGY